jgi:hypothetical protein
LRPTREEKRLGKRIGIVGSRHFASREVVQRFLESMPRDAIVVSGGAEGVDSWSVEIGRSLGMQTLVFQADWHRRGRKAGPIRNAEIVGHIDELVAFWDGRSRGTLNTIALATKAGLPVTVFDQAGDIVPSEGVLEQAHLRGVIAGIEKATVKGCT